MIENKIKNREIDSKQIVNRLSVVMNSIKRIYM